MDYLAWEAIRRVADKMDQRTLRGWIRIGENALRHGPRALDLLVDESDGLVIGAEHGYGDWPPGDGRKRALEARQECRDARLYIRDEISQLEAKLRALYAASDYAGQAHAALVEAGDAAE